MDKLPPELLTKILLYLPALDRVSCSLVCRRWAGLMSSSELLHDVWLGIAGHEIDAATSVLVESQRRYTNLLLCKADLSKFNCAFWGRIGESLRVLELEACSWPVVVFYNVLRQCKKLESLRIVMKDGDGISIYDFITSMREIANPRQDPLFEPLGLLVPQRLHLDFTINARILGFMLELMPHVKSISATLHSEFEYYFVDKLPACFNEDDTTRQGRLIGSHEWDIDEEAIIKLTKATSESLEEVRIRCSALEASTCDAIANCTSLRMVSIDSRGALTGSYLQKLASNSPNLEVLELRFSAYLKDEDLRPIFELKKLRSLSLTGFTQRLKSDFKYRFGEISTLVELDLRGFDVNGQIIRSLGGLTNLRSLTLRDTVDSECFEAICETFGRLTKLDLTWIKNLKDADLVKLCRLKELRSLSLREGYRLTDLAFKRGVGPRELKHLTIECCLLTDAALKNIASHHDSLETLRLLECERLTEAAVLTLLQKQPRLKELCLDECVIDRWQKVREACPRLRSCLERFNHERALWDPSYKIRALGPDSPASDGLLS